MALRRRRLKSLFETVSALPPNAASLELLANDCSLWPARHRRFRVGDFKSALKRGTVALESGSRMAVESGSSRPPNRGSSIGAPSRTECPQCPARRGPKASKP